MVPDQQAIQYDYNGNFPDGARQLLRGQAIPFDTTQARMGPQADSTSSLVHSRLDAGHLEHGQVPQPTGNSKCKHVFSLFTTVKHVHVYGQCILACQQG